MIDFRSAFLSRSFASVLVFMLGSFSLGMAIAFPSPVNIRLISEFGYTPSELGLFGAITSLTAILGPLMTSPALRYGGRKFVVRLVCAINVAAYLIILASSETLRWLPIVNRAVVGICAGSFSSVIPMFIMDFASKETRNIYGTMHQVGITLGIIFVNGVGPFIPWRLLSMLAMVPPAVLFYFIAWVPEPPSRFGLMALQETIGGESSLCSTAYRKSAIVALFLMVFQQASGINAVLTNFEEILQLATGPVIAASAQLVGVAASVVYVDRLGRKNTWIVSCLGSAVSLYILAWDQKTRLDMGITIAAAFLFMFFFCFGLGPIPHYMIPVLFPDAMRPIAAGVFSSVNWFMSFVVILLYPNLIMWMGGEKTMITFLIILVIAAIFGYVALKPSVADEDKIIYGSTGTDLDTRDGFGQALPNALNSNQ